MAADEDGNFTFVVAHRDSGVHNWLDTGGLKRTIFGKRWQAFNRAAEHEHEEPWITARLVGFDKLERELPGGVRRIEPGGRGAQLADRLAGFKRRFEEKPLEAISEFS